MVGFMLLSCVVSEALSCFRSPSNGWIATGRKLVLSPNGAGWKCVTGARDENTPVVVVLCCRVCPR